MYNTEYFPLFLLISIKDNFLYTNLKCKYDMPMWYSGKAMDLRSAGLEFEMWFLVVNSWATNFLTLSFLLIPNISKFFDLIICEKNNNLIIFYYKISQKQ
jgi:hypothetical protein